MKCDTYNSLLNSLSQNAVIEDANGVEVEVRSCFDRKKGELDPRTAFAAKLDRKTFEAHCEEYDPELLPNAEHLFGPQNPEDYTALELLRIQFGWTSTDISEGIITELIQIAYPHGLVPIWKYESQSDKTDRPCLIFFHGGGFFAGVTATVENQCKLLAQLSGAVVISVDYPLAPENKFPIGFDACYAAVEWAFSNATTLGISPQKIGVSGDSAGGNLALICALKNRDEKKGMIAYEALIYPTLSRAMDSSSPHFFWQPDFYENSTNDAYIEEEIRIIGKTNKFLNECYLPNGTDLLNPYISPIAGSTAGLPKTLMMLAEYDFLRPECEEYCRRLKADGIDTRYIRYGGIVHGTFDRLGYAPQVEDMLMEIAKDLKTL